MVGPPLRPVWRRSSAGTHRAHSLQSDDVVTGDRRSRVSARRGNLQATVGHTPHGRDPVRGDRRARRTRGPRRRRPLGRQRDGPDAGRGHPGARVVHGCLPDRPAGAAARGGRPDSAARDRTAVDDRLRRPCRGPALRRDDVRRGRDPRRDPRADRCGARAGRRHQSAGSRADPARPQCRERPQRRDLCAPAVRGGGDRRRRVGDLGRPQRDHPAARGDRLRRAGRGGCGSSDRGRADPRRPPRADRGQVAAGDPGGRRRPRLRPGRRARRLRLHRRLRGGHRLQGCAEARSRGMQPSRRGGGQRTQRRHVPALRRHPARSGARRDQLRRSCSTPFSA